MPQWNNNSFFAELVLVFLFCTYVRKNNEMPDSIFESWNFKIFHTEKCVSGICWRQYEAYTLGLDMYTVAQCKISQL